MISFRWPMIELDQSFVFFSKVLIEHKISFDCVMVKNEFALI